jgi:Spy/CpxP family protein refolding chaperone
MSAGQLNFSSLAAKTTTNSTASKGSTGIGTSFAPPAFGLNAASTGGGTAAIGAAAKNPPFSLSAQKPAAEESVVVPDEIANKTVKAVLESFEAQLERQARQFQLQARQITRWDRSIYECLDLLQHLGQQIKNVDDAQRQLEQACDSLLQEQENLIRELSQAPPPSTSSGSAERTRLYQLAHDLGEQFLSMEIQLKGLVNDGQEPRPPTSDADKIKEITTCHLDSMRWLADQCSMLEERLDLIQRRVPGSR